MFDPDSRYAALTPYTVTDSRGRQVSVIPVPAAPGERLLGIFVMRQGVRLDHLAAQYLADPTEWWRICERNDAMLPEQLTEAPEVEIPGGGS